MLDLKYKKKRKKKRKKEKDRGQFSPESITLEYSIEALILF